MHTLDYVTTDYADRLRSNTWTIDSVAANQIGPQTIQHECERERETERQ